jgi:alpha-tubulin suppressor-like RCC1 family protein
MIAAGGSHTCAAFQAGGVQCWGNNSSGQLGNQATLFSQATPVWVANLNETIQSLAAGFQSTCAVTYSGRLYGWGANVDGQLGNGTFADASQPKIVTGLPTTVTAVATGSSHTCARLQNQQIYCWGSDVDGELGIGAKTYSHVQYHRQNEGEKELSSKIGFQLSHWKSSKQESSRWILSRYYRC